MNLQVDVEWPCGAETVEIELPDDATQTEIEEAAKEAFHDLCNYGYWVNGEPQ